MTVTAVEVLVDGTGKRRGRVCRRDDGRYQYVTETLIEETADCLPYWRNDYPPSGIFERQGEVTDALTDDLGGAIRLEGTNPVSFNLSVGPYPEPTFARVR